MENKDCGRCGKCCEAIWLGYSKEELSKFEDNYDAKYIIENWEEITEEEFKKINPYFHTQFKDPGVLKKHNSHWYRCNSFDKEKKLCKDYENRPLLCKGFPMYDHQNGTNKIIKGKRKLIPDYALYSKDCVFQKSKATWDEWNANKKETDEVIKKVLKI